MSHRLATKLVHAGEPRPRKDGAVAMPIYQSATFEYAGQTDYHDVRYIRLNNTPNHLVLHAKLTALEGAEDALVTASGMAAIATALSTVLRAGDHVLVQNCLYGGTHDLVTNDFPSLGISYDFIDADRPETWSARLKHTTKAVYVESMTNPLLHVGDLKAVAEFAKRHSLVSLIDNTFPSPYNFRPIELGFDLSLHSCTKYLNGHSDIVAGAVIGNAELIRSVTHKLNHFGGSLDPHACSLLHRGMKTLAVRMKEHNANALELASFLESHSRVARVYYPGLESHPRHARARELFDGFSGMLSFELDAGAGADQLMSALRLPVCAPSLGGVETLITRPATTSHAGMSPADRHALGIGDELIRVSVGIEAIDDLIADFDQALAASA